MEEIEQQIGQDEHSYAIIGAAMEVHRVLGHGFLEAVYQEGLEAEFRIRSIPFTSQVELPIVYKGKLLATKYKADFVLYDQIILEIKALADLTMNEQGQLLNYLKASSFRRGLLINFGTRSLQYKRFIWRH